MDFTIDTALALGTVVLGLYSAAEQKVTSARSERASALAELHAHAAAQGLSPAQTEALIAEVEETGTVGNLHIFPMQQQAETGESLLGLAGSTTAPAEAAPAPVTQEAVDEAMMAEFFTQEAPAPIIDAPVISGGVSDVGAKPRRKRVTKQIVEEGKVGTTVQPVSSAKKETPAQKKKHAEEMTASGEVLPGPGVEKSGKAAIRQAEKLALKLGSKKANTVTVEAASSSKAAVKAAKKRGVKKANAEEKKTGVPTTANVEVPAKGEKKTKHARHAKAGKSVFVSVDCRHGGMKRVSARSLGY